MEWQSPVWRENRDPNSKAITLTFLLLNNPGTWSPGQWRFHWDKGLRRKKKVLLCQMMMSVGCKTLCWCLIMLVLWVWKSERCLGDIIGPLNRLYLVQMLVYLLQRALAVNKEAVSSCAINGQRKGFWRGQQLKERRHFFCSLVFLFSLFSLLFPLFSFYLSAYLNIPKR